MIGDLSRRLPCSPLIVAVITLCIFGCHSIVETPLAHAQATTATLNGIVHDESGAVVPNVSVAVTNEATQIKRETTTNKDGFFTFPLLKPGNYTIDARRDGFIPAKYKNITLEVGDQVSLRIDLKVGAIGDTVTVEGGTALIQGDGAVGTVINREFVGNLPLNGRSFQTLITLAPGAVLTKATAESPGQFSVNGQRANANYFVVDGVGANIGVSATLAQGQTGGGTLPGLSASGGTANLVSVDALQEFRIQTSTYAPEFGRTPGGQVSIVTRSGTNQFRGTLFEYFRNDALDAADWFGNALTLPKPALRQNDFGGVLGGPIIKDRTFFFASYEGLRLRQPRTIITSVPSLTARQLAPAPLQPFLNAFPLPNGPDAIGEDGLPTGLARFAGSFSNPSRLDAGSLRVDHTLTQKVTLFGRYNYAPSESIERGGGRSLNSLFKSQIDLQTLTLGSTQSLTPGIANEVRANYSQTEGSGTDLLDSYGGGSPPDDALLFPSFASRDNSRLFFGIGSGTQYFVGKNVGHTQRQFNLVDNLTFTAGNHQPKFGVDYRRLLPTYAPRTYEQFINFRGVGITLPETPHPNGSVLSGRTSSATVSAREAVPIMINNFSAYGQDTWKVGPRLTLTYGLRWEVNPAPKGRKGKELFTLQGIDDLATATLAPTGTPLYQTTHTNFAPRAGVAYQLARGTGRESVLRGGFGIFYDMGIGLTADGAVNFPHLGSRSLGSVNYPLDPSLATPPPISSAPPFSTRFVIADPDLALPRTYQWNLAIEQYLGSDQSVSASYVGALGRRLLRLESIPGTVLEANPLFTSSSLASVARNEATSDYHALQLQFQRRLSRGVQALVSYTWSHSIDIASDDANFGASAGRIDPRQDRGPSDFDIRHVLSAAVTYNIPRPKIGRIGGLFLRDWSVDTIVRAQSAAPVNVSHSFIAAFGEPVSTRPDLVPGVPLYIKDNTVPGGKQINLDAFVMPPTDEDDESISLRQGTLGRNALRGFPFWQADLALRRQINLTERFNLQFRAEFFNIFNHPNFADPIGDLSGDLGPFGQSIRMFGQSLGTGGIGGGLNPIYQLGGPRSIQFALKFGF